jgi:hypothetical protein
MLNPEEAQPQYLLYFFLAGDLLLPSPYIYHILLYKRSLADSVLTSSTFSKSGVNALSLFENKGCNFLFHEYKLLPNTCSQDLTSMLQASFQILPFPSKEALQGGR